MRVIFLDIDGVLNSHEWFAKPSEERREGLFKVDDPETWLGMLDPEAVARLDRLARESGAKVVISSSWRQALPWSDIWALLKKRGFSGEVIGATTSSHGLHPTRPTVRGDQIAHWLACDAFRNGEAVESFVILDDDSDMAHLAGRHVHTSFGCGLTDHDVDRALAILDFPLMPTPTEAA